jgi:hypothetical protein
LGGFGVEYTTLRHEGKPGEALSLYEQVLAETAPASAMARRALVGIGTGYRASGNAAMREAVEEQADRSGPLRAVALELLLNSHIARSNSKAGLQAADALQQQFAGTEHAAYAQVNRYFLHARAGDRAAAKQALSTFTENHAAELGRAARRADLARWLLQRQEDGTSEAKPKRKHATADQTTNATPDQFVATSYPNPFQQQATIRYELPERRRRGPAGGRVLLPARSRGRDAHRRHDARRIADGDF